MAKKVGVIGAGSFGTAIANLLAKNVDVILHCRQPKLAKDINEVQHASPRCRKYHKGRCLC